MATRRNWDRPRIERLISKFGTAHFMSDTPPLISEEDLAVGRRAIQTGKIPVTGENLELKTFLLEMDEYELLKMENTIERWACRASSDDVSVLFDSLSADELFVLNFLINRSKKRQKKESEALAELHERITKNSRRNERRRARKT